MQNRLHPHPPVVFGYKPAAQPSNEVVTTDVTTLPGLEARARSGDSQAFGTLIADWDNDLRGVAWSVLRSASDTDDVMQTAYEKAFRTVSSFRGESSMKTWLHSICYRTAIDHLRFEGRRRHDDADALVSMRASDSPSETASASVDLASVLDSLDPEVRALLMLTAGLGYTFDETAEIVGLERGTIASRVSRAKKALRQLNQPPPAEPKETRR